VRDEPQDLKGLKEGELPVQWDTTATTLYVGITLFPLGRNVFGNEAENLSDLLE
jgi:hypothetical protein